MLNGGIGFAHAISDLATGKKLSSTKEGKVYEETDVSVGRDWFARRLCFARRRNGWYKRSIQQFQRPEQQPDQGHWYADDNEHEPEQHVTIATVL